MKTLYNKNIIVYLKGENQIINVSIVQGEPLKGFDLMIDGFYVAGLNSKGKLNLYPFIKSDLFETDTSGRIKIENI